MLEALILIVKISAVVIMPVIFVAAFRKNVDVMRILTTAMIVGLIAMIVLSFM